MKRAMTYDATGPFYRAILMNYALGGNFNSRIMQSLREDKGYTYGASSGFSANEYTGAFVAASAVRTDVTADAIDAFFEEINAYAATGPTDAEVAFTRQALSQTEALSYETPRAKAGLLSNMLRFDLEQDVIAQQQAVLASVSRESLAATAADLLDANDMVILVVGDGDSVRPQLRAAGYEIVDIDMSGAILDAAGRTEYSGGISK